MSSLPRLAVAIGLLVGPVTAAGAQSPAPSPPSPPPCSAAEYRQFDFWLGEWDVRDAQGQVVGENRIESALGGCVVRESWTGRRGMKGTSLNTYDATTGRWHQTWMDDQGLLLLLEGGLREGKMVLEGESLSAREAGLRVRNRITWERVPEGRVRQLWEASRDAGQSWTVVFDGLYVPAR